MICANSIDGAKKAIEAEICSSMSDYEIVKIAETGIIAVIS